tara:strand:- start:231 stop:1751 length:1521 start_codon:yes stop_codon:yes gene_type:complete
MKKNILALFISFLFSAPITIEEGERVASNTFKEFSNKNIQDFDLSFVESIIDNNNNLIYIYHLSPQGFVLVSANNNYHPVLGYSFENNFITSNMPDNLNFVFNNIKSNISNSINNLLRSNEIQAEWNKYLGDVSQTRERNVSPLLDAEFDQSGAWNNILTSETGFNGPVGCVAVSMAQIMHYWGYPENGEGTNAYWEDDLGNLEVDFSQQYYDYDNMAATYATNPSRLLLYHSGVAVNMDYENGGSGAAVVGVYPSAEYAMKTFFKYDNAITNHDSEDYDLTEYRNMLKEELNMGKPILYSGYSDTYGNGGHAWNIDGYQSNNMHCNWGWGGYSNGYFNLVTMNGFDTWQNALLNLIPEIYANPLSLFEFDVEDMTATFIDLSEFINESQIATWNWNFGDGTTISNTYSFAEHTYNQPGEYPVSLSVTNVYGQTGPSHYETITIGTSLQGDVNGDTIVNILDVVMLVNFVLGSDNPNNMEQSAADYNNDGVLNILDVVSTVNIILG